MTNSTLPTSGQGSRGGRGERARQLDAIAWAVFFIWAGIAMLMMPWGWFLLGVGVIILAAQFARWQIDLNIDRFWLACGAVIFVGGLWTLLDLPWSLGPILLILLGVVLLVKTAIGFCR